MNFKEEILQGIPNELPEMPEMDSKISRAPKRPLTLNHEECKLAIKNALRYFKQEWHDKLAPEFALELKEYGQIYMLRFRPSYDMYARPIEEYPGMLTDTKAIMHMIQNNLDPRVAQHPYELVTYGGNGTVFPNWAQYLLTMQYLAQMEDGQTLHLYSGHPMGLYPAPLGGPRVVVTNGMMIPAFSTDEEYRKLAAIGATSYGQMTAGSFMYIGPQGIVHGTFLTVLGAAQIHLGLEPGQDLAGVVFVSSGLGGMSGAQAKAAYIAGAVCVIAEVNPVQAKKLNEQGWIEELTDDLGQVAKRIEECRESKEALSLGYVGNVVDLWRYFNEKGIKVDLGSDQTSLHAPYSGGYYPAGISLDESQRLMANDPEAFKEKVHESLREHVKQVNQLSANGMFFWDYGNAFLRMAEVAGADVMQGDRFKYPSYVENIMGPQYFDYGFGPFRWVCTSANPDDLKKSDEIAAGVMKDLLEEAPDEIKSQMFINHQWIEKADENKLVVGSQARILYSDMEGRRLIAQELNKAVKDGVISAPIVLGRDHHDVSGTDSPYRETANIYDGTSHCADMSVHNFAGLGFQGATWMSLHNGGGVGWGYVMNGGFGMVLDGTEHVSKKIDALFPWDVGNGVSRRAWAQNPAARFAIERAQEKHGLKITLANKAEDSCLDAAIKDVGL
jgi:urocanate hydratase